MTTCNSKKMLGDKSFKIDKKQEEIERETNNVL